MWRSFAQSERLADADAELVRRVRDGSDVVQGWSR